MKKISDNSDKSNKKIEASLLFSTNLLDDPKMIDFMIDFGFEGVGIFTALILEMRKSDDLNIKKQFLKTYSYKFRIDPKKLDLVLAKLVEVGLFYESEIGFHSYDLDSKMQSYYNKVNKLAENGRKGGIKNLDQKISDSVSVKAIAKQMPSNCLAIAKLNNNTNTNNNINIRSKIEDLERIYASVPAPEQPKIPKPILKPPKQDLELPEHLQKHAATICERLDSPDGSKTWEASNIYMATGRRPMLGDYGEIWLTPSELGEILEQFESDNIMHRMREANQIVLARLKTMKAKNKDPSFASVASWYMGWVKQEIIKAETNTLKLKTQVKYANNATATR